MSVSEHIKAIRKAKSPEEVFDMWNKAANDQDNGVLSEDELVAVHRGTWDILVSALRQVRPT